MPNHVTTKCIVTGPAADVEQFRQALFVTDDPKALFDFNKIIPMPECLRDATEGGYADIGAQLIIYRGSSCPPFADHGQLFRDHVRKDVDMPDAPVGEVAAAYLAKHPKAEQEGRAFLSNILETGFNSWYLWSLEKWGTKWGALSVKVLESSPGRFVFEFQTAWSFPNPIFAALIDQHPTLTFDLMSFDEGWNFACVGQLGAAVTQAFAKVEPSDELYEAVYGEPPEREEEDA